MVNPRDFGVIVVLIAAGAFFPGRSARAALLTDREVDACALMPVTVKPVTY